MLYPIRILGTKNVAVATRRPAWQRFLVAMLIVVPLSLVLTSGEAWGCPTCKDGMAAGDDASVNLARGYFYSILLMLAMPFTLASCFGMYVWREFRRQQRDGGSADLIAALESQRAAPPHPVAVRDESASIAAGSHVS
ncbi:MAG: hypothetical protein ACO3NZ_00990 [Pirellulales bacterium]|jgi:hypothetical protein